MSSVVGITKPELRAQQQAAIWPPVCRPREFLPFRKTPDTGDERRFSGVQEISGAEHTSFTWCRAAPQRLARRTSPEVQPVASGPPVATAALAHRVVPPAVTATPLSPWIPRTAFLETFRFSVG